MKKYLIYIALGCMAMGAQAQSNSPAAMEQLKMKMLWFNSQNAAGMAHDESRLNHGNFSNVNFDYAHQEGDFRRPQEGEKVNNFGVSSEGFVNLKRGYAWGAFSFQQSNLTDAGYNASITDPFRGMPYYVIDTHQSKWRNQYYDLRFRVATPLLGERWTVGMEGIYQASLAAKQRDPRVDTRFYTLKLIPGVTYRINDANRLGLSLRYESIKEDSRMENETDIDQKYYILYGLGTAIEGLGHGREANYYGDKVGAALQYNYSNQAWNLLIEAAYDVRAESVEQSFTTPKKDAGVKDKTAQLLATAYRQGDAYAHYLQAGYLNRHIDGIQYVSKRDDSESQSGWLELFKSIRSTYKTQQAEATYAVMKNRGSEYNWKLEAGVKYTNQDDEYLLPYSVKCAENLLFSLGGKKNFVLGERMENRLLLDLHVAYNNNLGGEYVYGGSHADYISVTELETQDSQYLTSNYWRMGGSLTYSQLMKATGKSTLFVQAAFDRMTTSDYDYSGRSFLSIRAGVNF